MFASVRRSLLRPSARPTLSFSLSTTTSTTPHTTTTTTTTTTTNPTTPSSSTPTNPEDSLAAIVDTVDDSATNPRSAKTWRVFHQGNIIRPSDLSREKCQNSRRTTRSTRTPPTAPVARYNDVFRQLNLDPVDFTLNPHVLSAYVSEMGKIYGRNITGLTSRSQRRLGKAIRRARMIGIIPQLSRFSKLYYSKNGRSLSSF